MPEVKISGLDPTTTLKLLEVVDENNLSGSLTKAQLISILFPFGQSWYKEFTLPAATADTAVDFLSDLEVGSGNRPVLHGWTIKNGSGAWTVEELSISITSSDEANTVLFIEEAAGAFDNFARYWGFVRDGGSASLNAFFDLNPNPVGKGLRIKGSANDGSASDLEWSAWGVII